MFTPNDYCTREERLTTCTIRDNYYDNCIINQRKCVKTRTGDLPVVEENSRVFTPSQVPFKNCLFLDMSVHAMP